MKYLIATIEILIPPLVIIIAFLLSTILIRGFHDLRRRNGTDKKALEFGEAELDQGYEKLPKPLEPDVPAEPDVEGFRAD